jgi:hypothetical protein
MFETGCLLRPYGLACFHIKNYIPHVLRPSMLRETYLLEATIAPIAEKNIQAPLGASLRAQTQYP